MIDPSLPAQRTGGMWPLFLTVAVLCAGAVVLGLGLYERLTPTPPHVAALPMPTPQAAAMPPASAAPPPPVFDIVRITPDGNAVLAGHAAPGAQITILDGGAAIGHATADAGGDWTWIPDTPLPPGQRSLTLAERLPDGTTLSGTTLSGTGPILATIPPRETLASAPKASAPQASPPLASPPLASPAGAAPEAAANHVVAAGDSLWRLARQNYGTGQRYVVIYDANRTKITDPSRIYPGQAFTVPAAPAAPTR